MEWAAAAGALVVLFVIHWRWGQYWFNPQRRLDRHLRSCEACQQKTRTVPAGLPLSDWLCPAGAALYRKMLRAK